MKSTNFIINSKEVLSRLFEISIFPNLYLRQFFLLLLH